MKSAEVIGWALGGLEREISSTRERLSQLTAQAGELRARLGRDGGSASQPQARATAAAMPPASKRGRRRFTAAQRREISERMKRQWAERRAKANK